MLNIDQEKYRFWGKYRYPISNIGMVNIDMKYRYIKKKISIFRYRYCITTVNIHSGQVCQHRKKKSKVHSPRNLKFTLFFQQTSYLCIYDLVLSLTLGMQGSQSRQNRIFTYGAEFKHYNFKKSTQSRINLVLLFFNKNKKKVHKS